MKLLNIFHLCVILNSVALGSCWQYFTSLKDLVLSNSVPVQQRTHSLYEYGDCRRKDLKFYTHIYLDHLEILGKIIIRGWLDLQRIPTCIKLRAVSFEEDTFRSTAFAFQICVPRITYCHSQRRYKYYYYEWYIPTDLVGGMNWHLYFLGPPTLSWQ